MRESLMSSASRMSISALNQTDDPDRQVRIWLLSSVDVKGTIYYRVAGRFVTSGQTWQVNRRYSEFLMLRDTLVKYFSRAMDTCPGCLNYLFAVKQFDFPKKHMFVSKSQLVINYRIKALRSFMNLLASWAFSNSPKCPTCGGFAFDIVRNFVLEGADAVGESNMNYIRESFVVSTFTEPGRRSSITRRNSFMPASSSSHALSAQPRNSQSDLYRRNTFDFQMEDGRSRNGNSAAFESFSGDRVRQSTSQSHAVQSRATTSNAPHNQENQRPSTRSTNGRNPAKPHPSTDTASRPVSQNGSFLLYQDGSQQPGRSASATSSHHAPLSSTGSKRGILKNRNDVRSQNDSYISLGASSTASGDANGYPSSTNKRGILKNRNDNRSENNSYFSLGNSSNHSREAEEYAAPPQSNARGLSKSQLESRNNAVRYDRSQNDSYLSLGGDSAVGDPENECYPQQPSVQPPPTQKYVGSSRERQAAAQPHVTNDESFVSDSFVDNSLRFDGMNAPHAVVDDDDDSSSDDDDEIDITGVAIDGPLQRHKSTSGEGLWQPWELAKAG